MSDVVANGELHLTGLLMLGPHLTPDNHVDVLGRAKFRTKKELAKLVRELQPLPRIPDVMEPLGPGRDVTGRDVTGGETGGTERSGDRPEEAPFSNAPARSELPPITGPQQYQVQFSTTEEHVQLVERAKALLARSSPGATLGELHLQAATHPGKGKT